MDSSAIDVLAVRVGKVLDARRFERLGHTEAHPKSETAAARTGFCRKRTAISAKLRRAMRAFSLALSLVAFAAAPAFAERIQFSADGMTGVAGSSSDTTRLSGNAYVLTESMEIYADTISMSGRDFRYIEADGNVKGKNLETNMEFSCGRLSYDRETEIATLRDNVHLDDTENEVSADAQIIEYNQSADIAVLQIDVTLTQKDNVCKSAYAVYRKRTQMLELSGNSQITQGSDTFRAQEITLNLDTQEIALDGRVRGSVVDERGGSSDAESDANNADAESDSQNADGATDADAPTTATDGGKA